MDLTIAEIKIGNGYLAITPMPGRQGHYADDLGRILSWQPSLVISLATRAELDSYAPTFAADLAQNDCAWLHFPISDFGTPEVVWSDAARMAHRVLARNGKLLVHCMMGCGRSGMIALRLMVEAGENPKQALIRLRSFRPCAVETDAQYTWAVNPGHVD